MRVIVIEDDDSVRAALKRALLVHNWEVLLAANGAEGLDQAQHRAPDVIVLDVGMPDIGGLDLCRRLRAKGNRTPILMLTARVEVPDRVAGLEAGADDYLAKPYDVSELNARLRALVRRARGSESNQELWFAGIELDPTCHTATIEGRPVELTKTEFTLLEVLMANPGRVLSAQVIYDRVWGYDFGRDSSTLRIYIGYLRRKLESGGEKRRIQTVRGVGYVLREP